MHTYTDTKRGGTEPSRLAASVGGKDLAAIEPEDDPAYAGRVAAAPPTSRPQPTRRLVPGLIWCNALLLAALIGATFDPFRAEIARLTGLWHECEIFPPSTSGTAGWRWPLLLLLIPFGAGALFGLWQRGVFDTFDSVGPREVSRRTMLLIVVSLVGAACAFLIWLVPTSTCVS